MPQSSYWCHLRPEVYCILSSRNSVGEEENPLGFSQNVHQLVTLQYVFRWWSLTLRMCSCRSSTDRWSKKGPITSHGTHQFDQRVTWVHYQRSQHKNSHAEIVITNSMGFTQKIPSGTELGQVSELSLIDNKIPMKNSSQERMTSTTSKSYLQDWRPEGIYYLKMFIKTFLSKQDRDLQCVPPDLLTMIVHHRSVFSLEEDKRGETNLLQCSIWQQYWIIFLPNIILTVCSICCTTRWCRKQVQFHLLTFPGTDSPVVWNRQFSIL